MTQRTIVIMTIACIFAICAASFSGSFLANQLTQKQKTENFEALRQEVFDLKMKIDTMDKQTQSASFEPDNEEIKSLIEDLELKINEIQSDVSNIESDVGNIESDVGSIQLKIGY